MKVETIGVAVDGSTVSGLVMETVDFLSRSEGVESIKVACALPAAIAVADGVVNFPASAVDEMYQDAEKVLARAEERLADVPCKVETYVLRGRDVAETLSTFFKEQGCQMIVMGNRGQGGVKGYLGSVSRKVLLRATCPVVVVKDTNV